MKKLFATAILVALSFSAIAANLPSVQLKSAPAVATAVSATPAAPAKAKATSLAKASTGASCYVKTVDPSPYGDTPEVTGTTTGWALTRVPCQSKA